MSIHTAVKQQLAALLAEDQPEPAVLNGALRLLAKYRHTLLTNTIVARYGTRVQNGPFAGMRFVERATHGSHASKLLGCYEQELHPIIMGLPGRRYEAVVNIGCAEGYYAVGLKRLMPSTQVFAYDIDPHGREATRRVAEMNGVEVTIGGEFAGTDFERFAGRRVLVVCDIEGAERELMDPRRYPALAGMDALIEFHRVRDGSHTVDAVPERFQATHTVEMIRQRWRSVALPEMFDTLGELDALLAVWDWRADPTPWAFMDAKVPAKTPTKAA